MSVKASPKSGSHFHVKLSLGSELSIINKEALILLCATTIGEIPPPFVIEMHVLPTGYWRVIPFSCYSVNSHIPGTTTRI